MAKLLIIADDFTGALDTGIQFVKKHINAEIYSDDSGLDAGSAGADVIVVNSDTRNADADKAYARVRSIVRAGLSLGVTCIYKKTDSALRGNIGSELQAVIDETGMNCVQFVPALPHMDRVTKGGIHYIDGVPAAESEFSRDDYSPVRHSAVSDIIAEESEAMVHIHTDFRASTTPGIHVYDACTENDLRMIAGSIADSGTVRLMAGCSGMAEFVPDILGLSGNRSGDMPLLPGLLVVCGSTNYITREQLDYAERAGMKRFRLGPEKTLGTCTDAVSGTEETASECVLALRTAGSLIIDTNDIESGATREYADVAGLSQEEVRFRISDTLGRLLKSILDKGTRATLLLTGGDTLLAFMKRIGINRLTPVREVAPGVVLSKMEYNDSTYPVISKSGGFGRRELIAELAEQTEERRSLMDRPIIGITMGDPYGSGADISVKALSDPKIYERCRPLVVGDVCCMRYAAKVAEKVSGIRVSINPVSSVREALYECGTIDVLDMGIMEDADIPKTDIPAPFNVGSCAKGGEAAFQYVKKVIELAMDHEINGTVTNAISKEAINMAGHHFSGHTEIYAKYTGTSRYTMMLAHDDFRVVHVSTHVSLREACDRVKKERVLEVIRIADDACKAIGISDPKIGVAGLNPHCGENGLFGREEIEEIQPAIDEAMAEGINIPEKKPTPPDTIFSKAIGGWYDIVVVMYHDQGHIPIKVKGFVYNREKKEWDAVAGINVTLGLPIIRVSVDHGTDFVHAGSGLSNEISLVNAIDYAVRLAEKPSI